MKTKDVLDYLKTVLTVKRNFAKRIGSHSVQGYVDALDEIDRVEQLLLEEEINGSRDAQIGDHQGQLETKESARAEIKTEKARRFSEVEKHITDADLNVGRDQSTNKDLPKGFH